MIELPEALVIAEQMDQALKGKVIAEGNRGNSSHKFAFSNGTAEEYVTIFAGKTVGASWGHGSSLLTRLEPSYTLVLGCGGERILFHESTENYPLKSVQSVEPISKGENLCKH